MKRVLSIVIVLFCLLNASAQSLSGTVMDSANHQVLPGAIVFIPQLKLGATTDANRKL